MALGDFFKGSKHRANAERLEGELQALRQQSQAELQTLRQQSQAELQALQQKSQEEVQAITNKSQEEIQILKSEYSNLKNQVQHNGMLDLVAVKKKIENENSLLSSVRREVAIARAELQEATKKKIQDENTVLSSIRGRIVQTQCDLQAARTKLKEAQEQILGAEETILLESFALYEPKYQFTNSAEYKARLDAIRENQKATAKGLSETIDSLDTESTGLVFNKSESKKLRKDVAKLALRSFNSESEYCIDNVKFNNIEKMEARIRRSFETCNKLLSVTNLYWKDMVLEQKLEELYLAHEYQVRRQAEKEAARQAREEQRELEKLEKEIREARAKIEKERRHFTSAIQKLQLRLGAASTEQERDNLQTRIDEISGQSSKLDDEEKMLDYREQNARAGYVYVISNIGAFGEGIYKIGMTRRLEPMDRVDELGDASVPFRFDVHAMVFSDNAPVLEAKLHSHFAAGRLNKINGRKEFFQADLRAIEAVIRANYDAVVEVVHTAPAEQYRESLQLTRPLESCTA